MAKSKNSFTEVEKIQVVKWFAEFYTPQQVSDLVAKEFGKNRSRCDLIKYRKSPVWQSLYHEHRAKFLEDLSTIPYANKAVRLSRLNRLIDRLFERAVPGKGWLFVVDRLLAALNQMAEETDGKVITIKHIHETLVYFAEVVKKHVPDEEARAAISAELRKFTKISNN